MERNLITMADETKVEGEETVTTAETITPDPSQKTPIEQEIAREQGKQQKTEKEKAEFTLKKNAERLAELGGDATEVLGLRKADEASGDDAPATMGAVKALLADKAKDTAIELADEIEDEHVRELTKLNLKRIIPSGDPREDLRLARLAAESAKNEKVLEEVGRAGKPRTHVSSAGAPSKPVEAEQELTASEQEFLKPPFNLTKEQIVKARPAA